MKNSILFIIICTLFFTYIAKAQDTIPMTDVPAMKEPVKGVFKDRKVINSYSTEMLKAGSLDLRLGQRFGDFGGLTEGRSTFYGLESISDLSIGLDYGITDDVLIGISRTKGAGPLRQNLNAHLKYRLISQKSKGFPISVALVGLGSYSTMAKSSVEDDLNFFAKNLHRFSYHSEVIISSKLSKVFSVQATGGLTYRNIVGANDSNELINVGLAARLQLNKSLGLIFDGRYMISDLRNNLQNIPIGGGLEWHISEGSTAQFIITNSKGIAETDYIPYTNDDWTNGEFRFGFNISKQISLK